MSDVVLQTHQLVKRFGDIARQEYLAVGITQALSPQADLATEPRWARINGTFGEDAALAKRVDAWRAKQTASVPVRPAD